MDVNERIKMLRSRGFILRDGVQGFITKGSLDRLAMDAAIISQNTQMASPHNSGVPVEFTAFIDPIVVEILTAPRNARAVFNEVKKGDWTTGYMKFQVDEYVGNTTPYNDYGNGATSDVNSVWPTREQYIFQTNVRYGDLEQDVSSKAKINLAASKQKSAARTIDIDANRFYLYGVQGRNIYGLLNEPNLPAALVPSVSTTVAGSTLWKDKGAKEIYRDVLTLYGYLVKNGNGTIDMSSDLMLTLTPEANVHLGEANDYGLSAKEMLDKYFGGSLKYETLPELSSTTAGDSIMMSAREILGTPTAQFGYSEKLRQGRVIAHSSFYEQKYVSTTYGCILYRPFGVAMMTGV